MRASGAQVPADWQVGPALFPEEASRAGLGGPCETGRGWRLPGHSHTPSARPRPAVGRADGCGHRAQGTGTAWPRSSARPAPAARGPVSKPRLTPRGTGRSKTPGEATAWFRSFPCPLLLPSPPCPPAPSHGSVSQALPPGNLTSEAARPRHCFSHPTRRPPGSLAPTFQTLGLTSLGSSVLLHRPWAFASMVPPPGMPLPTSRPRGKVPFERHPLCGTFVTILRAGRGEADRQSPTRGEAAWRNAGEREAGEEHPRPLSRPHPARLPP